MNPARNPWNTTLACCCIYLPKVFKIISNFAPWKYILSDNWAVFLQDVIFCYKLYVQSMSVMWCCDVWGCCNFMFTCSFGFQTTVLSIIHNIVSVFKTISELIHPLSTRICRNNKETCCIRGLRFAKNYISGISINFRTGDDWINVVW